MKAPQFTVTLAKALQNAEIPVTYELLSYKGDEQGVMPVLGISAIGQPTGFERFPIFDEAYRKVLVGKIVDRYWNYEVGLESADMFWNAVRRWLNMNMPYYNGLYQTIPFDRAMLTVDMNSTSIGENDSRSETSGESESKSGTKTKGKAFDNQMPITAMSENESYATSANENKGESDTAGKGSERGEAKSRDTAVNDSETKGFQGNANALLADFRANLLNTDELIVTAMRPLFMLIWKNTETATRGEYMRGLL